MWRKKAIPHEFKDASIIHLYKRKENAQVCDNHRGIFLLSIAGKILAQILLNRLNEYLDQAAFLPESQCGFRKDWILPSPSSFLPSSSLPLSPVSLLPATLHPGSLQLGNSERNAPPKKMYTLSKHLT